MGLSGQRPERRGAWASTRWSLVARVTDREQPEWEASWSQLFETYRAPMTRYVQGMLRRAGPSNGRVEDAEDIVQGFLTDCIDKAWLGRADANRGSFRVFVRTLLHRYTLNRLRKARAERRGGSRGVNPLPLNEHDISSVRGADARPEDEAFDRDWVRAAVKGALEQLRRVYERDAVVIEDLIRTDGQGSRDLCELLGVRRSQLDVIRFRARRRFARLFEGELAATVQSAIAFDDEWRALRPHLP